MIDIIGISNILYYSVIIIWVRLNDYMINIFTNKELKKIYISLSIVGFIILPSTSFILREIYIIAVYTYLVYLISIIYFGDNIKWIKLSVPMIIFYSEYYELPIYLYRVFNGNYLSINPYLVIIKLLTLIIISYMMNKYDMNNRYFIKHLIIFLIPYILISIPIIYIFNFNGIISPIILKFICLSDIILNIVKSDKIWESLKHS